MLRIWFLVIALGLSCMAWAGNELKIIPLRHVFAEDVLPTVQPLVGVGGTASAVGNKLIVRASPARMAEIEQVIASMDVARRTLRITVSRSQNARLGSREIGATGAVRRGDVTVRTTRNGRTPQGVVVDMNQRFSNTDEQASEFLSVMDGGRGVISVGQSIPFTETWVVFTHRYVRVQESVQFHDITTGFSVRPRVIGDEVEIEVAPRISSLSGGVIEFQELATTVRASLGEWVDLGGTMRSRDEVSREIFSAASASGIQDSQLRIKVE